MLRLFDLSMKISGFPLADARTFLRQICEIPDERFAEHVQRQKSEIVSYHQLYNPLYSEIANKISNWEELPVMKKSDFQRPLRERLSHGYNLKNVYVNKTSGSGGDPFVFAKDKFCHALIWANIIRRFGWYGIDLNNSFQARFYGMPVDFISNAKLRFKDFLSNRYRFSIFDLSDHGLEKVVNGFRSKNFDYINGYTSSIVLLAKYLEKKNLTLREVCPTLKVCIVTSEMLFDSDRILLEKQFGIPVVNEYGASELDIIAFEDPKGEWIVNSETLFIEILDEYDQPVANGQEGRIVVTSLYNKAHPMIRYEVGDYGILDERSTPKKPILKKLVGRTNDVAILPSGKKPAGMTFYSITKKLFNDEGNVKEFVIMQTKIDTFEIHYSSENALSRKETDHIEKVLTDYLEPGLNYVFTRKEKMTRSKSGKLKQFVSLINQA